MKMRLYRRIFKLVTSTFLGLALIFVGLGVFTARMAVFPKWYSREAPARELGSCSEYMRKVYVYCHDPLKAFNLPFTELSIENTEVNGHAGPIRTTGWVVAVDSRDQVRGTVVLVHGGGADRRAMLKHVGYLHQAGYHVVLIDCHNHGMSGRDGRGISFGLWESQSVVDAAIWAKQHLFEAGLRPVFVFGTSQGAFAALKAMAESPVIRGGVIENPYVSAERVLSEFPALSWEPRLVKKLAMVFVGAYLGHPLSELDVNAFGARIGSRPVFLIHGLADQVVSPLHSREIYDLLSPNSPSDELWFVPDGDHEQLWNIAQQAYEKRVLKFLEKAGGALQAVRPPSPSASN